MKTVNQPVRKKDAMQLVTGQPVYMDDVIPQDCLIVKLLRSPHANAIVKNIDTSRAMLVCPTAAPDELPAAVQAAVPTGSNLRGSAAYRTHLVGVLVKRAVQALGNLEVL